jgi:hypothetical protein
MAFAQALAGQDAALPCAVEADGFGGVVGTAGIKTAILPEIRADSQLVGA